MTMSDLSFIERYAAAHRMLTNTELLDDVRRSTPTWLIDQNIAAGREATEAVRRTGPVLRQTQPDVGWPEAMRMTAPTVGQATMLTAALFGCRPCPHINAVTVINAPDLMVADLNTRRVSCRRCARTIRHRIDDDRCEICDRPVPDDRFVPFMLAYAGVTYYGNAGESCCSWVIRQDQADECSNNG